MAVSYRYEKGKLRVDRGEFIDKGNYAFDPLHEDFGGGADPEGLKDSYHAFKDCDAEALAVGGNVRPSLGTYRIANDITLSAGWDLPEGVVIRPDNGVTVTFAGRVRGMGDRGTQLDTSAGGSFAVTGPEWFYGANGFAGTIVDRGGAVYNVKAFGATGDGSTNDRAAFVACEAAGDDCTIPAGTYLIGSDLTLTKRWDPRKGAILKPANGVTVTIDGPFNAGLYQCFDVSLGGSIKFGKGAVDRVYPQWWGAKANGSNDDSAAIQAAVDSIAAPTRTIGLGGCVFLPAGVYRVYSTVIIKRQVVLRGSSPASTTIYGGEANTFDILQTQDGDCGVRDVNIRGGDVGIHMIDTTRRCVIENCLIDYNRVGIKTTNGYINTIRSNKIIFNSCGMVVLGQSFQLNIHDNVIDNNFRVVGGRGGCGIYLVGSSGVSIRDNTIEGNRNSDKPEYGVGVYIGGSNQRTVLDCNWFEFNGSRNGAHIYIQGTFANKSSFRVNLETYALPTEHDVNSDFTTGFVQIDGSYLYLNSKHGILVEGARNITMSGATIVPVDTALDGQTMTDAEPITISRNDVKFAASGLTVVSTANPALIGNITGIKGSPVYCNVIPTSVENITLDGKPLFVVEMTMADAASILGMSWSPILTGPGSGHSRFYQDVASVGGGRGWTVYDTTNGKPLLSGVPDLNEDKQYLVIIGKVPSQRIIIPISGGFQNVTAWDGPYALVVPYAARPNAHEDPSSVQLEAGEYYGYAWLNTEQYDSVFRGATHLRIADLETHAILPTASAVPSNSKVAAEVGDRVWNSAPTAGGSIGWVCVTAGAPGTWKTFGSIAV